MVTIRAISTAAALLLAGPALAQEPLPPAQITLSWQFDRPQRRAAQPGPATDFNVNRALQVWAPTICLIGLLGAAYAASRD